MKTLGEIVKRFGQRSEMNETASCCEGRGHSHHHHEHQHETDATAVYQCPMKCEGDKTYSEPGICPVCGMYLAPVKD